MSALNTYTRSKHAIWIDLIWAVKCKQLSNGLQNNTAMYAWAHFQVLSESKSNQRKRINSKSGNQQQQQQQIQYFCIKSWNSFDFKYKTKI